MIQSPLLSRSRSPFERCSEDQQNECIFFEAMYGQEDKELFRVLDPNSAASSEYCYLEEETQRLVEECGYIFEHRVTSESPTPITQLCVRLQFRLVRLYPIEQPIIGCKSLIGASKQQCTDLLKYLQQFALQKLGQIMVFDLILAAGDWLNARVAESNQGSLHETMLETERLKNVETLRKMKEQADEMEKERKVESSLDRLTLDQEGELRRQWLRSTAGDPVSRIAESSASFIGNLSHTMSRYLKTHGSNSLRQPNCKTSTSSSLMQTVYVLQQELLQQKTLVGHLLAQWLVLCKSISGEDWTTSLLEYLASEDLIDERQCELIRYPGRLPVSALFPNADGSNPAMGLMSTPPEKLSRRLSMGEQERNAPLEPMGQKSDNGSAIVKSRYEQDFEQLEYLGSGAFGDVWKVRNRLDGIYYAVKRVQICKMNINDTASKLVAENKNLNRILREVTTLGRIQSPYVLRYHQAWIEECQVDGIIQSRDLQSRGVDTLRSSSFFENQLIDSTSLDAIHHEDHVDGAILSNRQLSLCIQTAYCPRTLSDFLKSDCSAASMSELWRLCRMMLEGLAHIHAHGIMHRDMKPSNIFIDSNGDIRIGDFGLATFEGKNDNDSADSDALPGYEHSRHIGTKLYASPEQEGEGGCREYDERTDIYSLGIIFFELWHPFKTSNDRIEQLTRLKEGVFPGRFVESHPRQWKLINLMIKRNIQDRPTATMLLQSDLLPPRMEDDFLNDALRVVANPNTTVFPRILDKLFSANRQSILSKPAVSQPVSQSLAAYTRILPHAVILEQRKAWVSSVLRGIFERHGAVRVSSPIFTTVAPESVVRDDEVTLMNPSGSLLGLRYDSRSHFIDTITDAYSDPHSSLVPDVLFKRYDIGSIFRNPGRPGVHPVELLRADLDIVGVDPLAAEIECLCVSSEILTTFDKDIEWVRIRISHRSLFDFILEQVDINSQSCPGFTKAMAECANSTSSCSRLDRWDGIRKILCSSGECVSEKQLNTLGRWFKTSTGTVSECIAAVRDHIHDGDDSQTRAIASVLDLMHFMDNALGPQFREKEFMLDLCSPAPNCDYDGIFFRIDVAFTSNPDFGDVIAVGGRFDTTLRKIPDSSSAQMVGVSWNVSRLVTQVTVPPNGILSSPDVLVCTIFDSKADSGDVVTAQLMKMEQLSLAAELWRNGISADVYYGLNAWQEQQEFAINRGVRYIVLMREKDILASLDFESMRVEGDYNIHLRVLTGSKGKQARDQAIKRSEVVSYFSHRI